MKSVKISEIVGAGIGLSCKNPKVSSISLIHIDCWIHVSKLG